MAAMFKKVKAASDATKKKEVIVTLEKIFFFKCMTKAHLFVYAK